MKQCSHSARAVMLTTATTVLLLCSACVTERTNSRGMPVKAPRESSPTKPSAARPTDPVAQPVTTGVTSARVQITVAPLGFVRYDAQTLPLISPDARFLATQEGQAPTWDTLLATNLQEPADESGIAVYTLTETSLTRTTTLPPGTLLGRDANTESFLVESVRPDASRWVGTVRWNAPDITWLVQGTTIASHASFVANSGTITYQRRDQGAAESVIVLRDETGNESTLTTPGVSYTYPTPSPDGTVIFACAITLEPSTTEFPAGTLDLVAVRVIDDAQHVHQKKLGAIIAQRPLGRFPDVLAAAHQVFAAVQPSAWCAPLATNNHSSITFAHPSRARAAVLNPTDATLTWMPEKSVSAAAWAGPNNSDVGYFCTAPKELLFQPWNTAGNTPQTTRILPAPYVPRIASSHLFCFGPSKQRPDELELLRVSIGAP